MFEMGDCDLYRVDFPTGCEELDVIVRNYGSVKGCLSFSGIPGPIFSSRTRIITRTRLLYSDTNLNRIRIAAVGSDISNRNRAPIVVKSGPI